MDFVDFLKENNNEEEYYYYNDNNYSDTYNMSFTPKYNSNEEFIENFMRIGHTNELINKNLQNESFTTQSSTNKSNIPDEKHNSSCSGDVSSLTQVKKGRPMKDCDIIYDEVTGMYYDPEVDPLEYKKARKRIQNRESAIRTRQKKKDNSKQIEKELDFIKKENYRLQYENKNLKIEKNFLIDQIKFMQSIIKSQNLLNTDRHDNLLNPRDIESNVVLRSTNHSSNEKTETDPEISSQSSYSVRAKPMNKLFSIFILCTFSVVYIAFNSAEDKAIIFSDNLTISPNSIDSPIQKPSLIKYFLDIILSSIILYSLYYFIDYIYRYFHQKQKKYIKAN